MNKLFNISVLDKQENQTYYFTGNGINIWYWDKTEGLYYDKVTLDMIYNKLLTATWIEDHSYNILEMKQ